MVIGSLKKQRDIPNSLISLTGRVNSRKNNNSIEFESSLERDYIILLEFDKYVSVYIEQPIVIAYHDEDNVLRTYTPDFYARYMNGVEQIIEIKYQSDLDENSDHYSSKFSAARDFCSERGIDFFVLTEAEIRTVKLFNANFLYRYSKPDQEVNHIRVVEILSTIHDHPFIVIKDLIERTSSNFMEKAENIHTLWCLVAKQKVFFNENEKLTMDSNVWNLKQNGEIIHK
jgi:hypothetical protein